MSTEYSLDPVIHEPSRLTLVAILNECETADFNFLLRATEFSRGRLSSHMAKLISAGYVEETKEFVNRKPRTEYELTARGRKAYKAYLKAWKKLTGATAKAAASRRRRSASGQS